ncbi:MAG: hypothetical protein FJW21_07215 [Acidimicrobiia bacterium]|nr:hypothetical protein [Acidimicrobiia bacterium]
MASGSGAAGSGVNNNTVVPDQRNCPAMRGVIDTHGTCGFAGDRPRAIIGSEKISLMSFASDR